MCLKQEKWASVRIWASLTRAKLWWLDNWVRASPKLQLLWGVPGLQWSVSIKSGPRKEQWWTGDRVMGGQGSLMHVGSEGWTVCVRSNRRATVAQIAQEVNAGSDRKVSEYTVHHSLLRMGLHSRRPVRVPMLTPVHRQKHQLWAREHQNWTTEQWKKVAWSDESCFL